MNSIVIISDSDSEEQQPPQVNCQSPLLLQARVIYLEHTNQDLQKQITYLKKQMVSSRAISEVQFREKDSREIKSEIKFISDSIRTSESLRQSQIYKHEEQKEILKAQVQMYKQKYSQAVSANLRKVKTLDKNEQNSARLELQVKTLRSEAGRHNQQSEALKRQVAKLQDERRRMSEQSLKQTTKIRQLQGEMYRGEQEYFRNVLSLQQNITQQAKTISLMDINLRNFGQELQKTRTRNEALRKSDKDLCVICYERSAILVNQECGHLICCQECQDGLVSCPVCRAQKTRFIRLWKA